ncbi:amidohydrolase [Haloterrigena sp. SYSU A121-1]|uniref:Amidohydrolase n=1 Tax=Haloterrigena gelatinilytica TaxID=2741724 RepID=A0A8J8GTL4_9EURY|nr:amidohydrolase family protein [Haloterrigena gelatinilytica]NUB93782.1 amidohydrolase [Haloterrigena gelatinilytica]
MTVSEREIIDVHVHMNPFWRMDADAKRTLEEHSADFERKVDLARNPERFLEYLDEQNVATAAIINYVSPILGYTHATNEWAATFRSEVSEPERVLAFGGFDPRVADDPTAEIDRILDEFDLDGVKIHPPHQGISANDYRDDPDTRNLEELRQLYARCAEANVPVMFHTGTSIFSGARSRYADPMPLDDVAVDFPNLNIIMAHGGRPMYTEEAWFLLRRHENVYLDISSFPPSNLLDYFPEIERVDDRVLFGSDWPGPMVPDIGDNAAIVEELELPENTIDRILRTNAESVFDI